MGLGGAGCSGPYCARAGMGTGGLDIWGGGVGCLTDFSLQRIFSGKMDWGVGVGLE